MCELFAVAIDGDMYFFQADITERQCLAIQEHIDLMAINSEMNNETVYESIIKSVHDEMHLDIRSVRIKRIFRKHKVWP